MTTEVAESGFQLIHSRGICCKPSDALQVVPQRVAQRSDCAAACVAEARCAFFNHDATHRHCVLCAGSCTLQLDFRYSTWSRQPFDSAAAVLERALVRRTNRSYSLAVYRNEHTVDALLPRLRLVWLHLLPKAALRELGRSGVCKWESGFPWRPFFVALGVWAQQPPEAIKLSRVRAATPAAAGQCIECCATSLPTRLQPYHPF